MKHEEEIALKFGVKKRLGLRLCTYR